MATMPRTNSMMMTGERERLTEAENKKSSNSGKAKAQNFVGQNKIYTNKTVFAIRDIK